MGQRADQRGAEAPDGRRIERRLAGDAADAVGAEQRLMFVFATGDPDLDLSWLDMRDAGIA